MMNTAPAKEPTEVVFILDRSGSMESLRSDAIGGFNSFIEEQKKLTDAANLTFVTFSTSCDTVLESVPMASATPITAKQYVPSGGTAYLDAIGLTIEGMLVKGSKDVVVVVMTDGEENSSRRFDKAKIAEMIASREADGWKFVFLGANMDAVKEGKSLGFLSASSFNATPAGIRHAYTRSSELVGSYRTSKA